MKLGKYIFDVTRYLPSIIYMGNHFFILSKPNCSIISQHFPEKDVNINQFLSHSKTANSSCHRTQNKFGNDPDHLLLIIVCVRQ